MRLAGLFVLGCGLIAACGGSVDASPAAQQSGQGGTGGGAGLDAGTGGMQQAGSGGAGLDAGTGGMQQAGSGGAAGAGGATPQAVYCKDDTGCQVLDNCCDCAALPVGVPTPGCDTPLCYVSACTEQGLPSTNPHCQAGHCTLDVECDAMKVECNGLPPTCEPGKVPAVKDKCWTGGCVDPMACMGVTDCSVCTAAGAVCVKNEAWTQSFHCVPKDPACPDVNCACYGSKVCIGSFTLCNEGPVGTQALSCSCPNC